TIQGKTATAEVCVPPPPTFALTPDSVGFNAIANGPSPAPQRVRIANSGGGVLAGVAIDSVHYVTATTGWLNAALTGPTAPDTVTLQPGTTALPTGAHTALVYLSAPNATNTP